MQNTTAERVLESLRKERAVLAPRTAGDGVCRLAPLERWAELDRRSLPLIPPKKVLLPPRELLFGWDDGTVRPAPQEAPAALILFPCDLYALGYLDRVFAADEPYRRRRSALFLLGVPCVPGEDCFCPPRESPPPFDLFLAEGRIWAGSAAGREAADPIPGLRIEEEALPPAFWAAAGSPLPRDLEALFAASAGHPLWREEGGRCLSCGACSAVCPTCYCFDVVDEVAAGGEVDRMRVWDNCFFRSHALVAGGHNFRPDRAARLRFRLEHKHLGFGELRGVSSCVGCGRCRKACPVDIDLSAVVARLAAEVNR